MKCSVCGTNNEEGFKFCVKCGSNLEDPNEINYEQVDMGGYHAEEEYSSDKAGFRMSGGTFTISDKAPSSQSSQLFTSEELNDTDEEFDFSKYDEENDVSLSSEPVKQGIPQGVQGVVPQGIQGMNPQFMQGINPQAMQGMNPQAMQGMNPQAVQGMNPQFMQGMNPQFIQGIVPPQGVVPQMDGGQANQQVQPNMNPYMNPMYPNQMIQPQLIGYDANGMPIYQAQPMMYAQPQPMGEQYAQPYQQANPNPMPNMQAQQQDFFSSKNTVPKKEEASEKPEKSVDFMDFFDGGQGKAKHREESSDDFFGKSSHGDMGSVSAPSADLDRLKKLEKKKYSYMNDTPIVDANKLVANEASKFNKMYMRGTAEVNADDLKSNIRAKRQDIMGVTADMSLSQINKNEHYKSRISMEGTSEVNADELEAYTPERKKSIMAGADRAVEAMPKKKTTYNDEIDAIELPEYMKAKKTARKDIPEIPGLPDL